MRSNHTANIQFFKHKIKKHKIKLIFVFIKIIFISLMKIKSNIMFKKVNRISNYSGEKGIKILNKKEKRNKKLFWWTLSILALALFFQLLFLIIKFHSI